MRISKKFLEEQKSFSYQQGFAQGQTKQVADTEKELKLREREIQLDLIESLTRLLDSATRIASYWYLIQ